MTSNDITQLFGIPGFRLSKLRPFFVRDEDHPYVFVELSRQNKRFQCPCGYETEVYYDGDFRQVRDVSFGEWAVYLLFFQVRVECPTCGVKTERLDWLDRKQRHTKRLAQFVALLCGMASCKAVADWLHLDWKPVKRFDRQALEARFKEPDLDGLRVLAVDEIAVKKGHHYATVIWDYATKRVVGAVEGRKEDSLEQFYLGLAYIYRSLYISVYYVIIPV